MTLCRVWMHGYPGFSGMGGMFFHTLFWIGIALLIAALVMFLIQKNKVSNATPSNDVYLDELKQMFVRGEISDVEYMHRRDVLSGKIHESHHQSVEAMFEPAEKEEDANHENV